MPSSRETVKGLALGSDKPTSVDDAPPLHRGKEYVSQEQRDRNRDSRAALANEFSQLPPGQRRQQAGEFRRRLQAICTSKSEYQGFWELQFQPVLDSNAPAAPVTRQTSATTPVSDLATAAIGLITAHPGVMTQKQCVMVLRGSPDPSLGARKLNRAVQYGRFEGQPRKDISAQIDSLIDSGRIVRGADGRLRAR